MSSEPISPGDTYSFTILNKSDGAQSYTLFSKAPNVEPAVKNIVSHAILVAKNIPPGDGIATMIIQRDNFYAVCGTMHQNEAVQVYALDRKPVRLGMGSASAGTTCVLKASSGTPCFNSLEATGLGEGKPGAFCLKVETYSYDVAQSDGYLVALGLSTAPNAQVGVHAFFTPFPKTIYQISPSKVYYIVPLALRPNEPKPDEIDLAKALQVDFSASSPDVQITHDNLNTLFISTEIPLPTPKL